MKWTSVPSVAKVLALISSSSMEIENSFSNAKMIVTTATESNSGMLPSNGVFDSIACTRSPNSNVFDKISLIWEVIRSTVVTVKNDWVIRGCIIKLNAGNWDRLIWNCSKCSRGLSCQGCISTIELLRANPLMIFPDLLRTCTTCPSAASVNALPSDRILKPLP